MFVEAFTHIMNAIVFTIVEHHHLATTLVIYIGTLQQGPGHGVFQVIAHVTVSVIAQVKAPKLASGFFAGFKQRILDLAILVFFAHHNRHRFLVFHAAPITHKG